MVIKEEVQRVYGGLNKYQQRFVSETNHLFEQVSPSVLKESSFIDFNSDDGILEIFLEHVETNDSPILFIVHRDMIEISCSGFDYYMDSIKQGLFNNLPEVVFYDKVVEFVSSILTGEFVVNLYLDKGKSVRSEILWKDDKYPYSQKNYSMLISLFVKKELEKKEIFVKPFIGL